MSCEYGDGDGGDWDGCGDGSVVGSGVGVLEGREGVRGVVWDGDGWCRGQGCGWGGAEGGALEAGWVVVVVVVEMGKRERQEAGWWGGSGGGGEEIDGWI